MNTATVIAALRALWKAIKWRISLARRRTGDKPTNLPPSGPVAVAGILAALLSLAAGCARFDPFWIKIGDTFGISKLTGEPLAAGGNAQMATGIDPYQPADAREVGLCTENVTETAPCPMK